MTTGTVKTQGTELFFVHTLQSDPTLVKMLCPTGITGVGGGTPDRIEKTCLDTTGSKEYVTGLRDTAPINVPFNFIPNSAAQQALISLKETGDEIEWYEGYADGTTLPTVDTDGTLVPPVGTSRTGVTWRGSVSELNFDVGNNDIVRGTLTILRSGSETWYLPTAIQ